MQAEQDRHCTCNNRLYCNRNHGIVEYPPQVPDKVRQALFEESSKIWPDTKNPIWYRSKESARMTELFRAMVAPFNTY